MPQVEAPLSPAPQPSPAATGPAQFATAFKGYDKIAVDTHIGKLKDELAATARHRDEATYSVAELTKALGYAQKELTDTKSALTRMADDPAGAAAMSERVKTMMRLAEEEIGELREKAQKEADATRDAADAYADKTRQKAQAVAEQLAKEAEAERATADQKALELRKAMQRKAEDEVALMRTETEKRVAAHKAQVEQQVAQHKAQVEQQVAAHKSEVEKRVAELEASSKQRTETMLSDAHKQLTEAKAMRKEALELRNLVFERLSASNSALQDALERLGDSPA